MRPISFHPSTSTLKNPAPCTPPLPGEYQWCPGKVLPLALPVHDRPYVHTSTRGLLNGLNILSVRLSVTGGHAPRPIPHRAGMVSVLAAVKIQGERSGPSFGFDPVACAQLSCRSWPFLKLFRLGPARSWPNRVFWARAN